MQTIDILNQLSKLRYSAEEEKKFWEEFLHLTSLLSKSDFALVVLKNDNKIEIAQEYYEKSYENSEIQSILNDTVSLFERASENGFAYERTNFQNRFAVYVKLDSFGKNNEHFLVLHIENSNKTELTNVILRTILCKDIPLSYNLFNSQNIHKESQVDNNLKDIIEIFNVLVIEKKFKLALMKFVDELSNRFEINRASIGWEFNDYVKPKAISYIEHFLPSSHASKALEAIYEEVYEQDEDIFYPLDIQSDLIINAHKIYVYENKLSSLYTFAIHLDDLVIGAVSLEKKEGEIDESQLEKIRLILNLAAPLLQKIYFEDQNIIKKSLLKINNSKSSLFGPRDSFKKLSVLIGSILFLWIIFGKMEYKVESVTNLQTDNIAYISAPFEGMVKDVFVDSGDKVLKDQLLLSFDQKEMLLKKLEINANILRYDTEAEKSRSKRQLADMKIAIAKKNQSLANLEKIDYFLQKANIKSPFEGIVVEGDKEKLLGSPFSKGDILIEIAKPTDLYAKVKVAEEYIDEIKVGQLAELNLLSRPDVYFNVRIDKIIPMASVDDLSGNVFVIKVLFEDDVQEWMRPGMSGIAKIKIEDRSIIWILTHRISDFLHMNVWW